MPSPNGVTGSETLPPEVRVHIVGAGPVGLMLAALFQPMERFSVHLYEKRREYTRTRMVQLRDYLVADSVASYCTDNIDGESVEALFDAEELDEGEPPRSDEVGENVQSQRGQLARVHCNTACRAPLRD